MSSLDIAAKSLPATIRATTDIWCQRDDQGHMTYQLFPAAALQLWDHHWHTSGLIPRFFSEDTSVIYEQDWSLTYQSITCYPQEGLMELTLEDGSSAQTHLWVDRTGPSTLYVSHMITLYDEVLATAVRVWTRRGSKAELPVPLSTPFTDQERDYFETEWAPDQTIWDFQLRLAERLLPGEQEQEEGKVKEHQSTIIYQNEENEDENNDNDNVEIGNEIHHKTLDIEENHRDDALKIDEVSTTSSVTGPSATMSPSSMNNYHKTDHHDSNGTTGGSRSSSSIPSKRKMTLSSTLSLESFGTFLPQLHGMFILAVRVGPQHLDFVSGGDGQWASTTWLADVAFQALVAAELVVESPGRQRPSQQQSISVAIRYRSVAFQGNELCCSLHGDRVFMIRSALPERGEKDGNQVVVLVAKAEPLQ